MRWHMLHVHLPVKFGMAISNENRPSPDYNRVIGNRPCIDYAKRLPNCLIIGMMKRGTFAFLTFLSAHPQVFRNESYTGLNFFGPNGRYWS